MKFSDIVWGLIHDPLRSGRHVYRDEPGRGERQANRYAQGWAQRRPLSRVRLQPINHGTGKDKAQFPRWEHA